MKSRVFDSQIEATRKKVQVFDGEVTGLIAANNYKQIASLVFSSAMFILYVFFDPLLPE